MLYLRMVHYLGYICALVGVMLGLHHHFFLLIIAITVISFIQGVVKLPARKMFRLGVLLLIVGFIRGSSVHIPYPGSNCEGYATKEVKGGVVVSVVKCETRLPVSVDVYVSCVSFGCGQLYTYRAVSILGAENLRVSGVFVESKNQTEFIAGRMVNAVYRFGNRIKYRLYEQYSQLSSREVASMGVSIVWGATYVSTELSSEMKALGIVHVMAVSGINITYLMSFVGALTAKLKKSYDLAIKLLLLVLLNGIVGTSVSLYRATLTFLIVFFQGVWGLRTDRNDILSVLAILVVLKPQYVFDYSYVLVSAACIAIYLIVPVAMKKASNKLLRELGTSLIVWLVVLPVQWYLFGEVTLFGGIITFLLSPLIEVITVVGYIVTPLVLLFGELFAYPYFVLVSLFVYVISVFHSLVGGG